MVCACLLPLADWISIQVESYVFNREIERLRQIQAAAYVDSFGVLDGTPISDDEMDEIREWVRNLREHTADGECPSCINETDLND